MRNRHYAANVFTKKIVTTTLLAVLLCFSFSSLTVAASSEEFVDRAVAYLKKNQLKEAVIELKNALQKDPKNTKARYVLGDTYIKLGNGASAEKELDQAIRLGMNEQDVVVNLAKSYLLQAQAQRVLQEIKIKDNFPAAVKADVYAIFANAYLATREIEKAEQQIKLSQQADPASLEGKLAQVRIFIARQNLEQALKLAEALAKEHGTDDNVWTLNGEIYRLKADFKKSAEAFAKAEKINPHNLAAKLGWATVAIAQDQHKPALEKIDSVIRSNPAHPMANFLKGAALYRKKDIAGAEAALGVVLKTFPSHVPSLQIMGAIHYSKGNFEQADFNLNKVIAAQPGNLAAAKLLGATRIQLKKPDQAAVVLEPFLAGHENDAQLMALLGSTYMQMKDRQDKGLEYLAKAAELSPNAASIHTQLALAQLATGQKSEAVENLESVVKFDSKLMQADILLTLVHLQNKEFKEALKQAEQMKGKSKNNPVAFNLSGAAYLGMGDQKKARSEFNKALKANSKFVPALMNLGQLEEQAGNVSKAKQQYNEILKISPGNLRAYMSLVRIAEKEGKSDEAIKLVQKARQENPNDPAPGLYLVQKYMQQNNPLKALSLARELKDKNPKNGNVLKSLGMAQLASDQVSNALATFSQLSKIYPDSVEGFYLLGKTHLAKDNLREARENLKKANAKNSKHIPTYLSLAELEIKSKKPGKAVGIAKDVQAMYPDLEVGYLLEGDIYLQQKDSVKAENAYEKGYNKLKTRQLLLKMFTASQRNGNSTSRYKAINDWISKNPDDGAALMLLASDYQVKKKSDEAIKLYRKVVKLDDKNIIALNNLAWLLHEKKKPESEKIAAKAYELNPKNPAVADTYGWILVENNKAEKGLTILQQAALQAPHLYDIRYHVAVAMNKLGRTSEAKQELEKIFAKSKEFDEAENAKKLYDSLIAK